MKIVRLFMLWALMLVSATGHAAPLRQAFGEITAPAPGSTLRGVISIQGSATHSDFWKYEVHVAPGANSSLPDDQWIRLAVREQQVTNGQLALWDTTSVSDGPYTLRLRVVRNDGNWDEFGYRTVNVSNRIPPTATPPPPTATPAPPTATPTLAATVTPQATVTAGATPTLGPTVTPPVVSTLPPSAATLTLPPVANATLTSSASATATAGVQPPIVVAQSVTPVAGETSPPSAATPNPNQGGSGSEGEGDAELGQLFNLNRLASACITGAGLAAAFFVLVGLVYLLRAVRQAIS